MRVTPMVSAIPRAATVENLAIPALVTESQVGPSWGRFDAGGGLPSGYALPPAIPSVFVPS